MEQSSWRERAKEEVGTAIDEHLDSEGTTSSSRRKNVEVDA
jgi:hypothetical protein